MWPNPALFSELKLPRGCHRSYYYIFPILYLNNDSLDLSAGLYSYTSNTVSYLLWSTRTTGQCSLESWFSNSWRSFPSLLLSFTFSSKSLTIILLKVGPMTQVENYSSIRKLHATRELSSVLKPILAQIKPQKKQETFKLFQRGHCPPNTFLLDFYIREENLYRCYWSLFSSPFLNDNWARTGYKTWWQAC